MLQGENKFSVNQRYILIIARKQPLRTSSKIAFVFLNINFHNAIVNIPTKTSWQHFKKEQLLMTLFTTRWLVIILRTLFHKETVPIDNNDDINWNPHQLHIQKYFIKNINWTIKLIFIGLEIFRNTGPTNVF